jgi:hypothetical protein
LDPSVEFDEPKQPGIPLVKPAPSRHPAHRASHPLFERKRTLLSVD